MKKIQLRMLFIVGALSAAVALALIFLPVAPGVDQNEAVRSCLTEQQLIPDNALEKRTIEAEIKKYPPRIKCYWAEKEDPSKVVTTTKYLTPVLPLWIVVEVLLWVPLAAAIVIAIRRGILRKREKAELAAEGDSADQADNVGSTTE